MADAVVWTCGTRLSSVSLTRNNTKCNLSTFVGVDPLERLWHGMIKSHGHILPYVRVKLGAFNINGLLLSPRGTG